MPGWIKVLWAFVLGGIKALFGGGGAKAPPKPADVVSEQAQAAPTLAATAARDEQQVADVRAAQTAQETQDAKADAARAAGDAVRADSVRQPSSIYADDGFRRD